MDLRYSKFFFGILIIMFLLTGCGGIKADTKNSDKVHIQAGGQISYGSLQEPDILNPLLSDNIKSTKLS
ncbi:hypothetical protein SDC9_203834 [bioreactor metagenome]|uniref:Uncharacterized protein n=1 Tax=bioreactor metagenome TaxID=1076179 RepID=A0A645IXK9_9ZZZZ